MNSLKLLLPTIRYLKFIQIYYRLYYFTRKKFRLLYYFRYPLSISSKYAQLLLNESVSSIESFKDEEFTFLNLSNMFEQKIDWNFTEYGKLWTYNLTYFEYLNQENISCDEGLLIINDFINQSANIKDGLEPFPISLRGINWIKFLIKYKVNEQHINDSLYAQYSILVDNLEYHLLGNHLLENGFSLLFGAYYFNDQKMLNKAKEILFKELDEQILNDGAHFELSPMYHQIMLFRVLDCINLLQNNEEIKDIKLLEFLQKKASLMLGWLKIVTFKNGSIPLLNDSANNIAPKSGQLFEYASRLNIKTKELTLKDSGYRKFYNENYECIVDVGNIGPDYIPGHAHADTFNFELQINRKPFIVDSGISTYDTNDRRTLERSTISHNTVEIDTMNQSEVWGGFRVANRAYVISLNEDNKSIKAIHDGYEKRLGILHEREFSFSDESIIILDTITSSKEHKTIARVHFHPSVDESMIRKYIILNKLDYVIKEYKYAPEFNLLIDAKVLEVKFTKKLKIKIKI